MKPWQLVISIIAFISLGLMYQNCSRASFVPQPFGLSINKSNMGDVYDGKPGTYYQMVPQFSCENRSVPRAVIDFNGQAYVLNENFSNLCGAVTGQELQRSDIDQSPYDPDYIGYKDAIFMRSETIPDPLSSTYNEAFCRPEVLDQSSGVDVAIRFDSSSQKATARIYYYLQNQHSIQSGAVMDLAVNRVLAGSSASYASPNFSLSVDRSAPAAQEWWFFKADLIATLDGVDVNKKMLCRMEALSRFLTVDPTENPMLANANPFSTTCATVNGKCSVNAAFQAASNFSVPVYIEFPNGTYNITNSLTIPPGRISLRGQSQAGVIIDGTGNALSLLIANNSTSHLMLSQMTLQNSQNTATNGGALQLSTKSVVGIDSCTFQKNKVFAAASGGAITVTSVPALYINNSLFLKNSAGWNGGALYIKDVDYVSIAKSVFDRNYVSLVDGAHFFIGNSNNINIKDSSFKNATSGLNSAWVEFSKNILLQGSTVENNVGVGLVIYDTNGAYLINSTISANSLGGLSYTNTHVVPGGDNIYLTNMTIAENGAPSKPSLFVSISDPSYSAVLVNSIISNLAGNACSTGPGSRYTVGYSIISDTTCPVGPGVQQNTNPQLSPLADNGGPTDTMSPAPDISTAIDKGTNASCPLVDQRGLRRPIKKNNGLTCDIGAIETQ